MRGSRAPGRVLDGGVVGGRVRQLDRPIAFGVCLDGANHCIAVDGDLAAVVLDGDRGPFSPLRVFPPRPRHLDGLTLGDHGGARDLGLCILPGLDRLDVRFGARHRLRLALDGSSRRRGQFDESVSVDRGRLGGLPVGGCTLRGFVLHALDGRRRGGEFSGAVIDREGNLRVLVCPALVHGEHALGCHNNIVDAEGSIRGILGDGGRNRVGTAVDHVDALVRRLAIEVGEVHDVVVLIRIQRQRPSTKIDPRLELAGGLVIDAHTGVLPLVALGRNVYFVEGVIHHDVGCVEIGPRVLLVELDHLKRLREIFQVIDLDLIPHTHREVGPPLRLVHPHIHHGGGLVLNIGHGDLLQECVSLRVEDQHGTTNAHECLAVGNTNFARMGEVDLRTLVLRELGGGEDLLQGGLVVYRDLIRDGIGHPYGVVRIVNIDPEGSLELDAGGLGRVLRNVGHGVQSNGLLDLHGLRINLGESGRGACSAKDGTGCPERVVLFRIRQLVLPWQTLGLFGTDVKTAVFARCRSRAVSRSRRRHCPVGLSRGQRSCESQGRCRGDSRPYLEAPRAEVVVGKHSDPHSFLNANGAQRP